MRGQPSQNGILENAGTLSLTPATATVVTITAMEIHPATLVAGSGTKSNMATVESRIENGLDDRIFEGGHSFDHGHEHGHGHGGHFHDTIFRDVR